jgi:hypothetical protein
MKKIFVILFSLFYLPAYAEEWLVIETTKHYQIKILQPTIKLADRVTVWQKLLRYDRTWFVAKVEWDCNTRQYKTLVAIESYRDDPPRVDYNVQDKFHFIETTADQIIYNTICN